MIFAHAVTGNILITCSNNNVITYNISYDLDGGSETTTNPTTYNIETNTFTLNNPTKTGHTFIGWTGSNGTTAQTTVTISKGSIGDKSYTANWEPIIYTVTFSLTNCKSTGNATAPYGSSYTATITTSGYVTVPRSVSISMGGTSLGSSQYSYTKTSKTSADLTINSVTGDIDISASTVISEIIVEINIYLDGVRNTKSSTTENISVRGQTTELSKTVTIANKKAGMLGLPQSVPEGFANYTFSTMSGSGAGFSWSCVKDDTVNSTTGEPAPKLVLSITLIRGTVPASVTIDIYGTSSS